MAGDAHGPSPKVLLCNAGAGAAAGVIAATFVCPLDVIKTRFQVHGLPQLTNSKIKGSVIVGSLEQIFQKEGLRGMYRGLAPTVLAMLPNWRQISLMKNDLSVKLLQVYFTIYDQLKSSLGADDVNHQLPLGANMMAAAGAGAATTIATNPLWVIKTRLQWSCASSSWLCGQDCKNKGTIQRSDILVLLIALRKYFSKRVSPDFTGVVPPTADNPSRRNHIYHEMIGFPSGSTPSNIIRMRFA
ncbi:UNVERIFIED_CONTAM: Nicotinamide adenine dinucleotide transporter 1, chloroplastic [Sesamum latifolium]|uniref:Nicotinamide adenine dinucleotide transporter 1, chloroplastic n=1 Tax=Sesamum latifolium TaxID=2727402 RepID=A0AAW2Y207_9LAMI